MVSDTCTTNLGQYPSFRKNYLIGFVVSYVNLTSNYVGFYLLSEHILSPLYPLTHNSSVCFNYHHNVFVAKLDKTKASYVGWF